MSLKLIGLPERSLAFRSWPARSIPSWYTPDGPLAQGRVSVSFEGFTPGASRSATWPRASAGSLSPGAAATSSKPQVAATSTKPGASPSGG